MNSSQASRSATIALFAALLTAVAYPVARGDAPTAAVFEGRWRYADGEEGRRQIERAVAEAVDGLPFFLEPVAEDRLGQRVGPFQELRFQIESDRVTFTADDWGPVTSRLDGPSVTVRGPRGTEVSMTTRLSDGRLVQTFEHPDGRRQNTFAPSGDGNVLWLRVSISSPQLPDDAQYRLRYRRQGGEQRQANR